MGIGSPFGSPTHGSPVVTYDGFHDCGSGGYAGPQVGGVDAKAKAAQKAVAAAAGSATTAALGTSLGTALGLSTAGAGAGIGGATASILGAAGVSVSVPVAGWIAAGVLAGTAATIAIVRAARSKGRREMEKIAARHGESGKMFAREYLQASKKSLEKNTKDLNKLTNQLRAMKGKRATKARTKSAAKIMEKQRALSIVMGTQIQPSERQKPMIAGDRKTSPIVAEQSTDWETYAMYAGVGAVGLVALAALAKRR